MLALLDVNNMYVSCERSFNQKLDNQPVVVLSNNDGCVRLVTRELTKRVPFNSG